MNKTDLAKMLGKAQKVEGRTGRYVIQREEAQRIYKIKVR